VQLVQHYNDLTEVNNLRCYGNFADDLKKLEGEIKTRIAFTDAKDYYETPKLLLAAGWKIAKKTLDWHDAHRGDSGVNLFYKIFPYNVSDVNDKQTRKRSIYTCHHSLSGSCSMGLWDKLDKDWIVNIQARCYPERYITLLRIDRKRTKEEIAKMRYYRYKLVFKSDVARYFCNGFDPEGWTEAMDRAFWAKPEAPKKNGFVYKP
jgi:hypothetical protein